MVANGYNAVLHTMVTIIKAQGPNIMILLSVTVYTLAQQTFSEEDVSRIFDILFYSKNSILFYFRHKKNLQKSYF